MAAWSLAVALVTAVLVQATLGSSPYPPAVVLLFAFLAATPLVAARMSFRVLDAFYQRRSRWGRKVLIYGAGRSGRMALCRILQDPSVELVLVGFIDDDPHLAGLSAEGSPGSRTAPTPWSSTSCHRPGPARWGVRRVDSMRKGGM